MTIFKLQEDLFWILSRIYFASYFTSCEKSANSICRASYRLLTRADHGVQHPLTFTGVWSADDLC